MLTDQEDSHDSNEKYIAHRSHIEEIKDNYKQRQISLLKKLTNVPKQMDPTNKCKICSYKTITDDLSEDEAEQS